MSTDLKSGEVNGGQLSTQSVLPASMQQRQENQYCEEDQNEIR